MKRIAYYFICFTFILFFAGCSAEKQTSANNTNSIELPTSNDETSSKLQSVNEDAVTLDQNNTSVSQETTQEAVQETAQEATSLPEKNIISSISLSHESGLYSSDFELTVSLDGNPEGATLYYTTDGSDPVSSNTKIAIEITDNKEFKIQISDRKNAKNVIAAINPSLYATSSSYLDKKKNVICSAELPKDSLVDKLSIFRSALVYNSKTIDEVRASYIIGTVFEHIPGVESSNKSSKNALAVISITCDYNDLFDEHSGIYMRGDIFNEAWANQLKVSPRSSAEDARKVDANYNQRGKEWEREVHIEFFEVEENSVTSVLSQNCGLRIQGNYSRSDIQKGLRLYARSEYGKSKFNYAVFGEKAKNQDDEIIKQFDRLVLRAGGNTTFNAKFNDTYWQEAFSELEVETQTSRPCVVYVNGEYFGLYVLEEDYSDDYFKEHFGVKKSSVIVYKGDAEKAGLGYKLDTGNLPKNVENEDYYLREVLDYIYSHNGICTNENLMEFGQLVDLESVKDYYLAQLYINNKWDWPGKNWVLWKTTDADSKWRFALLDLDFGGVSGGAEANSNTAKEANYKNYGILDLNTSNPAVLIFAYAMRNRNFCDEFCKEMNNGKDNIFNKEKLLSLLDTYSETYGPLFEQFFNRYPNLGSSENAINGGYASAKCIKDFITLREKYLSTMTGWIMGLIRQITPEEPEPVVELVPEKTTACVSEAENDSDISSESKFSFVDAAGTVFSCTLDKNAAYHNYDTDKFSTNNQDSYSFLKYEDDNYTSRIGIDISKYQEKIDWKLIKQSGIDFVFIRIGNRRWGETGEILEDPMFQDHYEKAREAGLDVGVYFYSQAISLEEAIEEAKFTISVLNGRELQLPIVLDCETVKSAGARTARKSKEQYNSFALAFCETIKNAGYDTCIYSNMYFEAFKWDMTLLKDIPFWYADYEALPQTPYDFTFWQYTSTGKIPGYKGNIDINIQLIKK